MADGTPASVNEATDAQAICLQCGLCCDGTMFDFVVLGEGETSALADMFEIELTDKGARFRQPCPHSRDCACTIYQDRPQSCRKFACKTLTQLSAGEVGRDEALARIAAVKRALVDLRPLLQPGETLLAARRRRTGKLAEGDRLEAGEARFVLGSVALDLLLERHFRTDDSRLFGSLADGELPND